MYLISQVWLDWEHAEDHPVPDTLQDTGHAEGLLPQPEEDPGDQPQASSHQGAAEEGGGQSCRQGCRRHGFDDV